MQSEYWSTEESIYTDSDKWTGGKENSADYDLQNNDSLTKLRISSSRAIKNSVFGNTLVVSYLNNIIGEGFRINISYPNEEKEKELNETLKEIIKYVDIDEETSLRRWISMLIFGSLERGDMLINLVHDSERFGLSKLYLELIESSRIETPPNEFMNPLIRSGVIYNKNGKKEGFYVKKLPNSPQEMDVLFQDYARLKIRNSDGKRTCFLFKAPINDRPNMSRQVPLLTPSLELLKYVGDYLEALLLSVKIAACFVGAMVSKNPLGTKQNLQDASGTKGLDPFKYVKLKPGTMMYTDGEASVNFASPNRPSDNVDAFLKRMCMFLSMTIRTPYTHVFLDMGDVNYTSYKAGLLEVEKAALSWREQITLILEWYLEYVILEMKVKNLVNFNYSKAKILITFPSAHTVDEEKQQRAEAISLENGTVSVQTLCSNRGISYEQILKERLTHKLDEVQLEAEALKLKKSLSEEYGIDFLSKDESSTKIVQNEKQKEVRKQDGNW